MSVDLKNATFLGYKRENGRVGVRNHVVILPVDDLSDAACEAVATMSRELSPSRTPTGDCSSAPIWNCTSVH
jgi:altronate dehydratase